MFPIRDDNPHFLTPYATYALIGLNVERAWASPIWYTPDPKLVKKAMSYPGLRNYLPE